MKAFSRTITMLTVMVVFTACRGTQNATNFSAADATLNKTSVGIEIITEPTSTITSTPFIPTSTSQPTPEPTATITATEIPFLDILNGNLPEELPPGLSVDLIWLQDGMLLRWDTTTNEISAWIGIGPEPEIRTTSRLADYQLTNSGDLLVVLENGEIGLIDTTLNSFQEKITVDLDFGNPSYKMSPDGQWLAYTKIIEGDQNIALYGYYLLNLIENSRPSLLGSCVQHPWTFSSWCRPNFVWTDDSSTLAWDGHEGVWTVNPGEMPEFVTQHQTFPDEGFYYSLIPQAWSPQGRYLYAFRSGWDGYLVYMIDTATGRTQSIPGAEYGWGVESHYELAWLPDGRLLMIFNPAYDWAEHEATIYRMSPSGEEILLLDRQATLPFFLGTVETSSEAVVAMRQIGNKFILLTDDFDNSSGVNIRLRELTISNFSLSDPTPLFSTVNPADYTKNVYWTADGNWALWENGSDGNAVLISISSGEVIQLDSILNDSACCFAWLEHEN